MLIQFQYPSNCSHAYKTSVSIQLQPCSCSYSHAHPITAMLMQMHDSSNRSHAHELQCPSNHSHAHANTGFIQSQSCSCNYSVHSIAVMLMHLQCSSNHNHAHAITGFIQSQPCSCKYSRQAHQITQTPSNLLVKMQRYSRKVEPQWQIFHVKIDMEMQRCTHNWAYTWEHKFYIPRTEFLCRDQWQMLWTIIQMLWTINGNKST